MLNKVRSIELIDGKILKPVYEYLAGNGEDFRIMVLPDHPTPVRLRTHTKVPVPFFIYSSDKERDGVEKFSEKTAIDTKYYIPEGHNLMGILTEK